VETQLQAYTKRTAIYLAVAIFLFAAVPVAKKVLPDSTFCRHPHIKVQNALADYCKRHQRYPERLDDLLEEYGIDKEKFGLYFITYVPHACYSNYTIMFNNMGGCNCKGVYRTGRFDIYGAQPAYSQTGHEWKTRLVRKCLRRYHERKGAFPEDLLVFKREDGDLLPFVDAENFDAQELSYAVSDDLQSFTLEGKRYESVPADPESTRQIETFLNALVRYTHLKNNYPDSFQDLVETHVYQGLWNDEEKQQYQNELEEASQFLQKFEYQYSRSDNGKIAFLNGEDVNCLDPELMTTAARKIALQHPGDEEGTIR
jgi:hypothetical protein